MDMFQVKEDESENAAETETENKNEDVEDAGNPDESEGLSLRNRSMSNKFYNMLRSGTLPEIVMQQWSKATTRDSQTKLINECFTKVGNKYKIKDEFLLPANYKKNQTTERLDTAMDNQSGFGRLLFRKKFNLEDHELDEAVRTGEVRMFRSGGVVLYSAVNVRLTAGVAKKTAEELSTDELNLDPETAMAFSAAFAALEPDVTLGPSHQVQLPQAPSSSTAKPFLDINFVQVLWTLGHQDFFSQEAFYFFNVWITRTIEPHATSSSCPKFFLLSMKHMGSRSSI